MPITETQFDARRYGYAFSLAACAGLLPLLAALALGPAVAQAQTQTPTTSVAKPAATAAKPTTAATKKTVRPHKTPPAAHQAASAAVAVPAPQATPAPVLPKWPANDTPADATVMWDSQGLRINAANSSLKQILKDVATETGAKVEGLSADQRIFGNYGPGTARDVLSQLLADTGYNVLLIGDQGQGTPREVVLSIGNTGKPPQNLNNQQPNANDDADTEEPPDATEQPRPPSPPPVNRAPFAPGGQPRTPQQIMQEMQQRDQQRQQELQQQQQNNPPR